MYLFIMHQSKFLTLICDVSIISCNTVDTVEETNIFSNDEEQKYPNDNIHFDKIQ